MKSIFSFFSKNQSFIYKALLFVFATLLVIYLLPKGGQFKYSFQKGKHWQYENLYAPFSFAIKKTQEDLDIEINEIRNKSIPYFEVDTSKVSETRNLYINLFEESFTADFIKAKKPKVKKVGLLIIDKLYSSGVLKENYPYASDKLIYLKNGSEVQKISFSQLYYIENIEIIIKEFVDKNSVSESELFLNELLSKVISPNVLFNNDLTETTINSEIEAINPNIGIIEKGSRIIAKGEVVEGEKFQKLNSFKAVFQSQVWSKSNYYWLLLGYSLLVMLVFFMLFLFMKNYRKEIYENNTKVSFIFFNIILMVFLTTIVVKYDVKMVYITPLCILPLVLKTFFDARLGLFVHVLTILLLGFIVPDSFQFLFLQTIAGMVTILTVSELYKRANLFI